jgi:hypothetical protein
MRLRKTEAEQAKGDGRNKREREDRRERRDIWAAIPETAARVGRSLNTRGLVLVQRESEAAGDAENGKISEEWVWSPAG